MTDPTQTPEQRARELLDTWLLSLNAMESWVYSDYEKLQAVIAQALRTARDQALEEAAVEVYRAWEFTITCGDVANAIRALKGTP